MNNICLLGRLTADPELRNTPNGISVTNFDVAVDRSYTPKGQEKQVDFIPVQAWRQTAEFLCKYFRKVSVSRCWAACSPGPTPTRTATSARPTKWWPTMCFSQNPRMVALRLFRLRWITVIARHRAHRRQRRISR